MTALMAAINLRRLAQHAIIFAPDAESPNVQIATNCHFDERFSRGEISLWRCGGDFSLRYAPFEMTTYPGSISTRSSESMNMNSGRPGTNTFHSEITNIEATGFWLLADDREYFVPFEDYPVFRSAKLEQIFDVRRIGPGQYHWPSLDADVELEALEHPEHYPLIWRDRRK